jgi:hypothetical protein
MTGDAPLRSSDQRRAQSRVGKRMEFNLEQARKAWLASETLDETIRRVARQCLMLKDGRSRIPDATATGVAR